MKKVFILKSKNLVTGEERLLSTFAYKNYQFAVDELKNLLINSRFELMKKNDDYNTDMTEILKGTIEVFETKKGQFCETSSKKPIKTYNYNF